MQFLSDRARAWLRDKFEKAVGTYYEGEEPPERIGQQVIVFANMHPHATRAEWTEFAAEFARECYRAGYLRGVEWVERDEQREGGPSPEEIANQLDPDWIWRRAVVLENGEHVVRDLRPEHEQIEEQLQFLERKGRRF